jgi:hypothetical protein
MIMGLAASSRVRFAAPTGPDLELSWEGFRELGLCAIAFLSMARFSPGGFMPWAFATGHLHPSRHGRMAIRNG